MKSPKKGQYKDLVHEHVGVPAKRSEMAQAIEWLLQSLNGPQVPPAPALTPDLWRSMRCREGATDCTCALCCWEIRYQPTFNAWSRSRQLRPKLWQNLPTLDRMLAMWAERSTYRSAAGAMMDRAHDEAEGPERSRTPWAIRRVEAALEVERAVIWAFLPDRARHGLGTVACIRALVASVRGIESSGLAEAKAVRSGRRGVLVDLAARGLIRAPKSHRDQIAVADRIAELETRMKGARG